MTSTSLPTIGDVIGGRYQIKSVIASGGMGIVMRGQHVKMGRDVAVKFLHSHLIQDTDIRQRFEREVDIAKDLTHPNVVHVYDYGETASGNLYLVMEYLEGDDLKNVLKAEQRFTVGRALNIMTQILDGLAEAHIRNVVHRDLKPANIFVTTDRHGNDLVKILDFGIAKSLQADQDITKTGTLCGTVAYMAPEAILAGGDSPSCDVYAAGLILLEMITGKRAFRGDSVAQTMMMQLQHNPTIPSRIEQSALGQLLQKATDKKTENRFADADAMLLALRNIAQLVDPNLRLTDEEVPQTEGDATHSASDLYRPQPFPTIPIPSVANAAQIAQLSENTQHLSIKDLEWEDVSDLPHETIDQAAPVPGDFRATEVLSQPAFTPGDFRATEVLSQPAFAPGDLRATEVLSQPSFDTSTSHSSTALTHAKPASSRKPVFIATAALLGVAVIATAVYFATASSVTNPPAPQLPAQQPQVAIAAIDPTRTQPDPQPAPPAPPQDVTTTIQTAPPGAEMFLDNVALGKSPVSITLKQNNLPANLLMVLDGYEEQSQVIHPESASTLRFELTAMPETPQPAEKAPAEETKTATPEPDTRPPATTKAPATKTSTKAPATKTSTTKTNDTKSASPNVDDLLDRYFD